MSKRKILEEKDFDRIKKYEGRKKPGTKRVMTTGEVAEYVGWSREIVRAVFKYATWPAYRRAHVARVRRAKVRRDEKRAADKQAQMREEIRTKRENHIPVMPSEAELKSSDDVIPDDEITKAFEDEEKPFTPSRPPRDQTNYWRVAIVVVVATLVLLWIVL